MTKAIFDFIQLPYIFDENKLLADLQNCMQFNWKSHFNKNDFAGLWEIISLRSKSGIETDIHAFSQNKYQNTALLNKCHYFNEIIDLFNCEKEAVRLMNLKAKSEIKTHRDNAGGYSDGFCRIHIPIITNANVSFIVNGNEIPMQVGQAWYANFSQPHSVKNEGETDRIHLVVDCIRNGWTDNLFEKLYYDFDQENNKHYSNEEIKQMIESLSKMDNLGAKNLIEKLKLKLYE